MASPSYFLLGNPPSSLSSSHSQRVNHFHSNSAYTRSNSPLQSKPLNFRSATQLFDESPQPKSITANKLNFTQNIREPHLSTNGRTVIQADTRGTSPHRLSIIRDLSHFTREGEIILGRGYHALILKTELIHDKFVVTSLVSMYAKCGDMQSAHKLFHRSSDLDIVSYNSLISGYARNGFLGQALNLFVHALSIGVMPNEYTFSIIVSTCGNVSAIKEGMQLHGYIVKMQYLNNTAVGNALLTMYSKCGMMEEVETLFQELPNKNEISWTAVITGFYRQESFDEALGQFNCMRRNKVIPNEHTYVITLASCGGLELLKYGRMFHAQIIQSGMNSGVFVGTAIIDMYSGCGEMSEAEKQLKEMGVVASVVSWNALLAGYVCNGKNEEAMEAFCKMVSDGVICDHFTYTNILKACSLLPSLASGEQIHSQVIRTNYASDVHVGSSLIAMYANCGSLVEAEFIFSEMPMRDVVSWNSIINAYSMHGRPKKALAVYTRMVEEGIKPTSTTFLAILSCCSHSGLVQEGQECFKSMIENFKIIPEEKHYSCIVDLLGRAGQLKNARDFINNLPIERNASIWRPLLAACRCHNDLQMAEYVAARILDIDPSDPTVFVTLSNMYANIGRWKDVEKQRMMMEDNEVKKEAGCSWIEIDNKLCKFYSRDMTHTDMPEILERLDILVKEVKNSGYDTDANIVLIQG